MKLINKDNQGKWISLAALVGLVSLMSLNRVLLAEDNQQKQQQTQVDTEIAAAIWIQFAYY